MNYYNEKDPYPAQWLRNLSEREDIPKGVVDVRSIAQVRGSELEQFTQCHFFAGIGGWPFALRLAGWPEDREVWTGSCPCQPYSVAGKQRGAEDPRNLWPAWLDLIAERMPATIFGEQVASKDGREWLAGVRTDLEALGYVVGAADLCAAGVGAPHIRQRLWWVADSDGRKPGDQGLQPGGEHGQFKEDEGVGLRLANSKNGNGRSGERDAKEGVGAGTKRRVGPAGCSIGSGLGNTACKQVGSSGQSRGQPDASFWIDSDLVHCADGKSRCVEPGIHPLAHGVPVRVGKLRAYGNAIVPEVAAVFIRACAEAMGEQVEEVGRQDYRRVRRPE